MQTKTYFLKATRRAGAAGLINLTQRRRWYGDGDGLKEGAGSSSAGTENTEHMVPKSRLDEVLSKNRELEAALAKQQTEAQQREQQRLQEEGKWKELAETRGQDLAKLQSFQQRAESLEKMIRDGNETRIKRVPEAMRGLIPTEYPPERLAAWLDANWDALTVNPAPNLDAGAGGSGGAGTATLTEAERAAAAKLGVKPEEYAKHKQQPKT